MATKWQEKNVGTLLKKGTSNKKPVTDERDGSIGGYHVEHWDDSQDAHVITKPVTARAKAQKE